ncbi:MAG: apolipoprotein N-acyltransferase [Alphaproteobacteria bacterium]
MALALPPIFFVPAIIPGVVALFWLLETTSSLKRAFGYGWALGFGYFVAGLYWLGHAIAVDLATFWWAMPFALFGLQSGLAIFFGLVSLVAVWVRRQFGVGSWGLVFLLVFNWLISDLLRSSILTGFPWNLLGTSLTLHPVFSQLASVGGVHLLTALVVTWAVSPALVVSGSGSGSGSGLGRRAAIASFIVLPILVGGFGLARINSLGAEADKSVAGVHLRLVQANIAQTLKWDPALSRANLQKHVDLSNEPLADNQPVPNLIIWPETAVPFALNRSVEAQQNLAAAVLGRAPDGVLITGANKVVGEQKTLEVWNHLYVLDALGNQVAGYDKHHLVPFGEYMPYRSILNFAKLTEGTVDFSAGPGPQTVRVPTIPPFSPIICYEGIFSGNVVDKTDGDAKWLLSVTNDGWFGLSSGPHQHLAATVLRSVEEGLPLVRASNSGVSVVADSLGRLRSKLGLGKVGVVDAALPTALENPPLYARYGLKTVMVLLISLLFGVVMSMRNKRKFN